MEDLHVFPRFLALTGQLLFTRGQGLMRVRRSAGVWFRMLYPGDMGSYIIHGNLAEDGSRNFDTHDPVREIDEA